MAVNRHEDTPYRRQSRDLDPGTRAHGVPLAAAAQMVGAGAVSAAMVGSDILLIWAFNLPLWLGPIRDAAVDAAGGWHAAMQAIGLADLHPAVRDAFRRFQSL